ncbi:protein MALE DISCOVERER 2-like isoform X2 [Typha latifolia]|uniref:protein MALE DISCOVERER 2-like isoform X2 n=1 Tax=Typha latifolia TaxID=4733 RepID=UPI003C2F53C5
MGGRWNSFGFHLHKFLSAVLMLHFLSDECFSLNIEGLALLKFRSRVEVDPYGVLENWDPRDSNPCNWNGVHCDDDKVVMLNLNEQSLVGTLAPELGKVSQLRALLLSKNNFAGLIPKEIGRLAMLEILDLRNNNLGGVIPVELGEMQSLKHLLVCNNNFDAGTPWTGEPNMHTDLKYELDRSCKLDAESGSLNRKVGYCLWQGGLQKLKMVSSIALLLKGNMQQVFGTLSLFRFKAGPSSELDKGHGDNLYAGSREFFGIPNSIAYIARRRLLEKTSNLPATSGSSSPAKEDVSVPPFGSGSYPAFIPKTDKKKSSPPHAPAVKPPESPSTPTKPLVNEPRSSKRSTLLYVLVLPVAALLLTMGACMLLACRSKGVATIGPWKTGISGQLQKAFVTGVPKLNRTELEGACEDFSNIIITFPEYTVFKGTLSSGVEIAVASTAITSTKDWSKRSEAQFRKKIDTLSQINHKNFVNLLGYCEEDEPFMRMMVFEYATNGTLYEHLHVEEFDHIDWTARMRIIMGTAYCLQHMHQLNPPIAHPDLQSSSIFLSEDYAAKVADISVWKDVIAKEKITGDGNYLSESTSADPAGNVYCFGILLLEIISGKSPYFEDGSLINLALECMNENRSIGSLLDPKLKTRKGKELDVICEVIQDCIHQDPKKRLKINEVVTKLREGIEISPEAAAPRLSPLWWAELEILSVEAS